MPKVETLCLPVKKKKKVLTPELDVEEEIEDEGEITEASLNMHGSFLPEEHYDYNPNTTLSHPDSTTTFNPYPFSFQTYDTYLRSPLRSPLHSSQWDDEEENQGLLLYHQPCLLYC